MLNKNLSNESRSQRLEREALTANTPILTQEEQEKASIDAAAAEAAAKATRKLERRNKATGPVDNPVAGAKPAGDPIVQSSPIAPTTLLGTKTPPKKRVTDCDGTDPGLEEGELEEPETGDCDNSSSSSSSRSYKKQKPEVVILQNQVETVFLKNLSYTARESCRIYCNKMKSLNRKVVFATMIDEDTWTQIDDVMDVWDVVDGINWSTWEPDELFAVFKRVIGDEKGETGIQDVFSVVKDLVLDASKNAVFDPIRTSYMIDYCQLMTEINRLYDMTSLTSAQIKIINEIAINNFGGKTRELHRPTKEKFKGELREKRSEFKSLMDFRMTALEMFKEYNVTCIFTGLEAGIRF